MTALTALLVAETPLQEVLDRVAELACQAVAPAVAVQLALHGEHGGPGSSAHSGPAVPPGDADRYDVLSVPLVAGSATVGALTLYALREQPLTAADAAAVTGFATTAAVVLANARAYWARYDMTVALQAAVDSRAVIDMAKGKLMASDDVSPDEAFALLVRASQRENVRVRDMARRIVEGPGGRATEAAC